MRCARKQEGEGDAKHEREVEEDGRRSPDAEAVIQESNIRFLAPVHGEMRASIEIPAEAEVDKFRKMLERARRGRIRLQVNVHAGATLATVFDGLFAAAMRR